MIVLRGTGCSVEGICPETASALLRPLPQQAAGPSLLCGRGWPQVSGHIPSTEKRLQPFEGSLDKVFDASGRVFFEDGGKDFIDVGLGEAEHDEGGRGLIDERAGINLEDRAGVGTCAFEVFVF